MLLHSDRTPRILLFCGHSPSFLKSSSAAFVPNLLGFLEGSIQFASAGDSDAGHQHLCVGPGGAGGAGREASG